MFCMVIFAGGKNATFLKNILGEEGQDSAPAHDGNSASGVSWFVLPGRQKNDKRQRKVVVEGAYTLRHPEFVTDHAPLEVCNGDWT